jgi:NAD(P)H-binding
VIRMSLRGDRPLVPLMSRDPSALAHRRRAERHVSSFTSCRPTVPTRIGSSASGRTSTQASHPTIAASRCDICSETAADTLRLTAGGESPAPPSALSPRADHDRDLGVGDTAALGNLLARKVFYEFLLKIPYADHLRQEEIRKASGLDWVIARPSSLTNGPARNRYVRTTKLESVPSRISRADVANFLVEAAEVGDRVGRAVQLGG